MMANFTITSNSYLRNLYSSNRNLVNSSVRKNLTVVDLGKADSAALKNGISSLSSYDYEREDADPENFKKTLKAFADSYNNALETGEGISKEDSRTKRLVNEMKQLEKNYGEELKEYGITFNSKGYMSISDTAMSTISVKKFKNILGEDSEFLADLDNVSKKLSRRINYLV